MNKQPKAGQKVSWKSHGGVAHGKVVEKLTRPTTIKSHKVAASPENPEFVVETSEGKRAAHKAGGSYKGIGDGWFPEADGQNGRQCEKGPCVALEIRTRRY